jgi:peptidyl-prolyl cis-trans isomerase SurA
MVFVPRNVAQFLFAGALLLASSARAELVDRVAAVVNSEIIPLSDVEAHAAPELAQARAEAKDRASVRREILKRVLDQMIGEKLLEAEMKELNIDVTDQEVDAAMEDVRKQQNWTPEQLEAALRQEGYTVRKYREEGLRPRLQRYKLLNLKVRGKVKVSDEDLKAEYAKLSKLESAEYEVHARHIFVRVAPNAEQKDVEVARKKASALAEEARKSGVDFVALAKAKSEGPSAHDGGDLGFFRRGLMEVSFEKVAFSLKPGEVSDPIKTQAGFHVIKVDERRAIPIRPFDEIKEQLRERVTRTQLDHYTELYIQELKRTSIVDVKI